MLLSQRQKNLKGITVMYVRIVTDSSYIYMSFYKALYVERFCFVVLLSFIVLTVMY